MQSKKLTASNEDVQRYLEQPDKQAKKAIIKEVKENALANGINFNKLFPKKTMRYKAFDTIVYLLSGGGICKVSSAKLAEMVGCKVGTVYNAVDFLKELGLFIVAGLSDGKNKYVFVYKKHKHFREILASVFYLSEEQNEERNEEQPNAENVDSKGIEGEKTDSINTISFISKHEKESIRESVENDVKKSNNQDEKAQEYLISIYQKHLYADIKESIKLSSEIRENALIIALRAGSNLDKSRYNEAMAAVRKIDKHLYFGGEVESVPALFDKIYRDRIKYSDYYKAKEAPKPKRDTSYLYDWLANDKEDSEVLV